MFRRFADNGNPLSLANKLREKRFFHFLSYISQFASPVNVLDIGGTYNFWQKIFQNKKINLNQNKFKITLVNLTKEDCLPGQIKSIVADARDLSCFKDKEFDLIFSNSVIEHVGSYEDQERMAREIRRLSDYYYIQTPNYYFPIEPHFLFPFFQFLPLSLKVFLLKNFTLGWTPRVDKTEDAVSIAQGVRLLTQDELIKLFPGTEIFKEKFLGLTKSLTAYASRENSKANLS